MHAPSSRMTSAAASQMDLFGEQLEPEPAEPVPVAWTHEERRSAELALVGVYHEIAVPAGLHSPGTKKHHAHAQACEAIAAYTRAALVDGLASVAGSAQRSAESHASHAAWRMTADGRAAYGPNAGDAAPRFRELAAEQRARYAWHQQLIAKVERVLERDLPVDQVELAGRAKRARENADASQRDMDAVWAELPSHWPVGMKQNGPTCDALDCKRCRP